MNFLDLSKAAAEWHSRSRATVAHFAVDVPDAGDLSAFTPLFSHFRAYLAFEQCLKSLKI